MESAKSEVRDRLIAGLVRAVAERGYAALTVQDVLVAASVSRRTFYEYFADKEECFLSAFELVQAELLELVRTASAPEEAWAERMQAGLVVGLRFLADRPDFARLLFVEPSSAGGRIAERQMQALLEFSAMLADGRPEPSGGPVASEVDNAVLGAVLSVIGARINAGEGQQLEELMPDLLEFGLAPYVGRSEAERMAATARAERGAK